MDPKIVKKTQETLGKAIKKPPLTEKLLNKPPFRFLHDIITEVIKNTGVLNGLFDDNELNSANVTDKDAKINFLQKAIDCVGIIIGEALTVRPSKIVAGHEPEKTNEFLQHLGKICLKKTDTSTSVEKVLAGEKPGRKKSGREKDSKVKDDASDGKREKKGKDDKKPKESVGSSKHKDDGKEKKAREGSSKEREGSSKERGGSSKDREGSSKERSSKEKERESSSKDRSATKESTRSKEEHSKERSKDDKENSKNREKDENSAEKPLDGNDGRDVMDTTNERIGSSKERDRRSHAGDRDKERNNKEEAEKSGEVAQNAETDDVPKTLQRPASAKGQRRRPSSHTGSGSDEEDQQDKDDDVANQMDVRKMSSIRRPSSARPAPPRIKKQQVKEEQPRINSGKAVAPVIVDNKKNIDEDDDDTFIVEEDPTLQDMLEAKPSESNPDFINTEEHGSLVRKMLESKKEADARQGLSKVEEKPVIFDAARKKEREIAEKEIEKLRNSIQLLVRSAHPLGKIMDYVQEDIDSMQKELMMWKEENKRHELALKAEQSVTENEIAPLQSHLTGLEQEIAEVIDSISVVKSNILRNEEKIEELVVGVSMF